MVTIEGPISVGEDVILRFHPWLRTLLDGLRRRGWSYHFTNVEGRARVRLDLDRIRFALRYHPPRIDEFEEKGSYEISAEVGDEPPALLEVLSVESFGLEVSTEHARHCVRVDPLKREITSIRDVLWRGFGEEEGPSRLSEAREVYEVVRFFLDRGYEIRSEYVARDYKKLIDLLEGSYRFDLVLELTVEREELVPGWRELKRDLWEFFRERGLLMEIKGKEGDPFSLFRKPIP